MNQSFFNFPSLKKRKENLSSLAYNTLGGLFWSFSGSSSQIILQMIVLMVLARILTPEDFGVVNAATVVIGISAIFAQLGIGPAIVQHPNLNIDHIKTGFTFSLIFGICLSGLIFAFAPLISSFFRMAGLRPIIQVLSLGFLFQGASIIAKSLLQKELRFRLLVIIEFISYLTGYGVIGIILAFLHYGAWALVMAQLAHAFIFSLLLIVFQPHAKMLRINRSALKELIGFGSGMTISSIFNYFARSGDYMVVGRFLGAESLGLYGRAFKLMTLPATVFGNVADRVLFPTLSKLQNDKDRLATTYRRSIAFIALLSLPTSIAMIVLGPEIIRVLLGPKWTGAIVPFRILAVGALFRTSYKISETVARAKGAVYSIAWIQGIYALLVITGAWVGMHRGISGVAIGIVAALCIVFILLSRLALHLTSISWKKFVGAHLSAVGLSALIGAELWPITLIMRNVALPPLAILIISIVVVLITMLILFLIKGKLFFGEDGVWVLQAVLKFLQKEK